MNGIDEGVQFNLSNDNNQIAGLHLESYPLMSAIQNSLFVGDSKDLTVELIDKPHFEALESFDTEIDLLACYETDFDFGSVEATITTDTADLAKTVKKIEKPKKNGTSSKHKNVRSPVICTFCTRAFTEPYNLRVHMMTHTGEKPYACDVCGKRFRQKTKLKIHCITHTNEKPHVCDICYKGFRYSNYLAVHRRLHTGEKPYNCLYCSDKFHSLHTRRMHVKLQHSGKVLTDIKLQPNSTKNITYTCSICSKILTDQCYLTAHLKRHHYKQRDFKCKKCGKCFFSAAELKNHDIAHTQLRSFPCEICGMRFLRKSNCTQHLKVHNKRQLLCS